MTDHRPPTDEELARARREASDRYAAGPGSRDIPPEVEALRIGAAARRAGLVEDTGTPPRFPPDVLHGTPVAYGVRWSAGHVNIPYPPLGYTIGSLEAAWHVTNHDRFALHPVPLYEATTATSHVLKIVELYDRLDDHAPQHIHDTSPVEGARLHCAACVLTELRTALGDLLP